MVEPIGRLLGADHVMASRLVVEDGKYSGSAWVDSITATPSGRRVARIIKNGNPSAIVASDTRDATNATTAVCMTWEDDLIGGDYLEVAIYHEDDEDIGCALKYFSARWHSL